jgi:hypothetical protein
MRQVRRFGSGLILVVVLIALLVAFAQRQELYDWWRLRDYEPPARVMELADSVTMTDYGRKLFYVHQPQLNDAAAFNRNCQGFEQSIILGCYVTRTGIYLYDVQDERLDGVEEVTAAHEMLHAAFDRLGGEEKQRIIGQLEAAFESLDNKRIKETMAAYQKRDASVVPNELHSIMATEVRNLPSELEDYYARYFKNRKKVVDYSERYEQAFTERKELVQRYDAQLARMKQQIESAESELNNQAQSLKLERARLDSLLSNNQTEQYNAAVPGYNSRIRAYNDRIAATRALIDKYNETVAARNAVAVEQHELIEALDSRLMPQAEE